jgi:transmembrane sensor
MSKPRADEVRIATEAARWQQTLSGGTCTERERAEFADWVKASPRHLREYLFAEALDAAATDVDPDRRMEVDLNAAASASNVTILSQNELPPSPTRKLAWLAAAAAGAAALALAWWVRPDLLGGWQRYDTGIGEQRSVQLPDGSVMQLNTDSRVRVRFSAGARDVRLLHGQVFFKVARDARRAFRVEAGAAVLRVLGTQFDVYHRDGATKVAVVEGLVEISAAAGRPAGAPGRQRAPESAQLAKAEAARIAPTGAGIARADADISAATAWQQRRLVFDEESLGHIAEEFNRYNVTPRLVIQDDALKRRRIGGTFDADDPESLLSFILLSGDLEVERKNGILLVRERRTTR